MDYAAAFVLAFLLLAAIVAAVVGLPLLRARDPEAGADGRRADLEAAKEAK